MSELDTIKKGCPLKYPIIFTPAYPIDTTSGVLVANNKEEIAECVLEALKRTPWGHVRVIAKGSPEHLFDVCEKCGSAV